ncbi:unnamed protein product [Rotaria sordida]|nr:unnamed protein product [Rotaria sordida]CAF3827905.1 unnamed protein product [Rotaria sordida]CAF4242895.1 unnamed protein product [Rotaria sordida]
MRFWIYFKSSNNGQLVVGYRYAIGDDIRPLSFSSYQSCQTNATQCSWQRIDVLLSSILTQPTEIMIGVRTGADRDGIMAIDDVTYTPQCVKYNGTIPTRPTTTTSTPTPYTGPPTTTSTSTPYTGPPTTTTTTPMGMTTTQGIATTTSTGRMTTTKDAGEKPPTKSNLGPILGGIFGGIALIALIIIGYIYCLPKIRAARDTNASDRLLASLPIGPITNPAYSETATSDA